MCRCLSTRSLSSTSKAPKHYCRLAIALKKLCRRSNHAFWARKLHHIVSVLFHKRRLPRAPHPLAQRAARLYHDLSSDALRCRHLQTRPRQSRTQSRSEAISRRVEHSGCWERVFAPHELRAPIVMHRCPAFASWRHCAFPSFSGTSRLLVDATPHHPAFLMAAHLWLCRRLFELVRCAIVIAARTWTLACRLCSFPPTSRSPSSTLALSAGKTPSQLAPPPSLSWRWLMDSRAGPRLFRYKLNAPSPSRTPFTPNWLRATAFLSRSILTAARNSSRPSSKSLHLVRHRKVT